MAWALRAGVSRREQNHGIDSIDFVRLSPVADAPVALTARASRSRHDAYVWHKYVSLQTSTGSINQQDTLRCQAAVVGNAYKVGGEGGRGARVSRPARRDVRRRLRSSSSASPGGPSRQGVIGPGAPLMPVSLTCTPRQQCELTQHKVCSRHQSRHFEENTSSFFFLGRS